MQIDIKKWHCVPYLFKYEKYVFDFVRKGMFFFFLVIFPKFGFMVYIYWRKVIHRADGELAFYAYFKNVNGPMTKCPTPPKKTSIKIDKNLGLGHNSVSKKI